MPAMDKKKLERDFYLVVENITFASTEIGDTVSGRSAATAWAKDDEVVFKGKLKHILAFALMAFDVASVAVNETFTIVNAREYTDVQNLGVSDIVAVVDLDPTAGEGVITDDDMSFLANLTNNFRLGWDAAKNIITQEKAAPANKALYRGTVLQALAFAYQWKDGGAAPVYTLYDFALMDSGSMLNQGVVYPAIDGVDGPVELDKAHVTLANLVLGAKE